MVPVVHPVEVLRGGEHIAAEIHQRTSQESPDRAQACLLTLVVEGKQFGASGRDFFEALVSIRRLLEPMGLLLNIYGSSRNVWPSGMARDMGQGLRCYKLTLGSKPSLQDLVDIFTTGPDVVPVTVAEQEAFVQRWLNSIGIAP